MTPFILFSCLSVVENINRSMIKAFPLHQQVPRCFVQVVSDAVTSEKEVLTCIIRERSSILVKDKPAFLPRLDLPTHFDQESSAGFIGDGQVETGVRVVSGYLDVAMKVKIIFSHREVTSQQPRLWKISSKHESDPFSTCLH